MLDHTYPTLPAHWYFDADHHRRELDAIWHRSWLAAGHESQWRRAGDFRSVTAGNLTCLVVRGKDGRLRAFHNTCRHRGAELSAQPAGRFRAGRIVCPYHAWSYGLDGRLLETPRRVETSDFDCADHGLYEVALTRWRGFVFVNAGQPPDETLEQALGREPDAVADWPLEDLVVAHRELHDVACNWKIFWENFAECAHCPGVHPALGRLVPLYREGFTSPDDLDAVGRGADRARLTGLRRGAVTWSESGSTELPWLAGLGPAHARQGQAFCTLWPALFLIAHVDYVRTVQVLPRGPEHTHMEVQWLLAADTLASGRVDIGQLTAFGRRVVSEDAAICETNQRGLRSPRHDAGVLMPQEYEVLAFDDWVRERLGQARLGR